MDKSAIISFKGTHDIFLNRFEFVTEGKYRTHNDSYSVTYEETELTGMEGTTTTLLIEKDKLTLTRTGSNNSLMIFEKNKTHVSCYETQHGDVSIGVSSKTLDVAVDDHGGEISATYAIEVNNSLTSINNFRISVVVQ